MIHISIDYTGIIPGLGRGPFTNIPISNTVYARLKAIGYPIKVLNSNKIVRNTVKKASPINEGVKPEETPLPPLEKPIPATTHTVSTPAAVAEPSITVNQVVIENPQESSAPVEVATVEEPEVEEKKIDLENLDTMTKEELDELLNQFTTERPGRYGKPWLIKTLKSYVNS